MTLPPAPPVTLSAAPVRRVGGASAGGLALPMAAPTADLMYAPRGVWTDGERLVVCDSGNHRVLVWHTLPDRDGAPADVVIGQPGFDVEGPDAGGRGPERGLHLPAGVGMVGGRLVVADGWHHRLVVWDSLPERNDEPPSSVLGQPDPSSVAPNRGGDPTMSSFYWPFGFGVAAGSFWVTDTGNRRVLGWHGDDVPEPGRPADVLLGQDDPGRREDNRGGEPSARSFRWPHDVAAVDDALFVADAGDHRVLGWCPAPAQDNDADVVLGQPGPTTADEFKNRPQGPDRMRFPYAVASSAGRLAVADTSNNRILLWDKAPRTGSAVAADAVLGQPDFAVNGENRWDAVTDDSMCWPYGLCWAGDLLAVADSGNNRVVLWRFG